MATRTATIDRETKETKIHLSIDLDGTGKADVATCADCPLPKVDADSLSRLAYGGADLELVTCR